MNNLRLNSFIFYILSLLCSCNSDFEASESGIDQVIVAKAVANDLFNTEICGKDGGPANGFVKALKTNSRKKFLLVNFSKINCSGKTFFNGVRGVRYLILDSDLKEQASISSIDENVVENSFAVFRSSSDCLKGQEVMHFDVPSSSFIFSKCLLK